jgi:poly(hydroxyalkanoate) depolymerase family esterase
VNDSLLDLMHEATRLTRTGRLDEATATIRRALAGATEGRGSPPSASRPADDDVIDGCITETPGRGRPARAALPGRDRVGGAGTAPAGTAPEAAGNAPARTAPEAAGNAPERAGTAPEPARRTGTGTRPPDRRADALARPPSAEGAFAGGTHAHGSMSRDYRLYVPPGPHDTPRPLVVMLHGCTQDPEDFAAGTDMNAHALAQRFFVLYPAQSGRANPQRCWNWFKHTHQRPHRGEPGLIVSMVRAVAAQHPIDPGRVYVAGLSAGGAMAAILGALHPEVFAAAGVHSGLAPGAAGTLPEALAAMRGGAQDASARPGLPSGIRTLTAQARAIRLPVPVIVFHGDGDPTVHPRNGEQVIAAHLGTEQAGRPATPAPRIERGTAAGGRGYTRTVHAGADGTTAAEHWVVHGAGHAWSGGRREGSFTDASGPDATGEMLRFFMAQPAKRAR